MLQFVLAMAVCGVIAVFDRPLIGLIGAAICVTVFAIRAYSPAGSLRRREGTIGRGTCFAKR